MRKTEYDRLNKVLGWRTSLYYTSATLTHFMYMAYASYFFRFRTLNKLQVLGVGTAYFFAFNFINNMQHKVIVERPFLQEVRNMGLGKHVQPNGTFGPRMLNF